MPRIGCTALLLLSLSITTAAAQDPTPHEGAMIDIPITIEPPDIIIVEVFNSPAERPITGERLVRPDGTISLGYYGELHISGLTIQQAKVKILLHLRKYMTDDALGLAARQPFGGPLKPNLPSPPGVARGSTPKIERQEVELDPKESMELYVDIAKYNSHVYYVLGDVGSPGKLTSTGRETVLDILQYAGGFLPTAEPADIHLYRPEQNGKPAQDFRINLEAIHKGVKTANLQVFPNDRLIVGRNPIVKKTVEIDRANALISTQLNAVLTYGYTARTIGAINSPLTSNNANPQIRINGQNAPLSLPDPLALTPAQRDAMIKDWAEFLWAISSKESGAMLDENVFKEALMKKLAPAPGTK